MAQVNFISTAFFKERFPTSAADASIARAISSAMYLHIMPVVGSALYADLTGKIEAGTLTGSSDVSLLRDFLKPLTREYAYYELIGAKSFSVEDTGNYVNAPANLKPLSVDEVKYYRGEILHMAQQLAEETKKYVRTNRASFPAFDTGDQFTQPGQADDDWFVGID